MPVQTNTQQKRLTPAIRCCHIENEFHATLTQLIHLTCLFSWNNKSAQEGRGGGQLCRQSSPTLHHLDGGDNWTTAGRDSQTVDFHYRATEMVTINGYLIKWWDIVHLKIQKDREIWTELLTSDMDRTSAQFWDASCINGFKICESVNKTYRCTRWTLKTWETWRSLWRENTKGTLQNTRWFTWQLKQNCKNCVRYTVRVGVNQKGRHAEQHRATSSLGPAGGAVR